MFTPLDGKNTQSKLNELAFEYAYTNYKSN